MSTLHTIRFFGAEKGQARPPSIEASAASGPAPRYEVEAATAGEALAILSARGSDLRGLDLSDLGASYGWERLNGFELAGVDLSGCRMSRTKLPGKDLAGTKLVGARIEEANLNECSLLGADLTSAVIVKTSFRGALIEGTSWRGGSLSAPDFSEVQWMLDRKQDASDAAADRYADFRAAGGHPDAFLGALITRPKLDRTEVPKEFATLRHCEIWNKAVTGGGAVTLGLLTLMGGSAIVDAAHAIATPDFAARVEAVVKGAEAALDVAKAVTEPAELVKLAAKAKLVKMEAAESAGLLFDTGKVLGTLLIGGAVTVGLIEPLRERVKRAAEVTAKTISEWDRAATEGALTLPAAANVLWDRLNYLVRSPSRSMLREIARGIDAWDERNGSPGRSWIIGKDRLGDVLFCDRRGLDAAMAEMAAREAGGRISRAGRVTVFRLENAGAEAPVSMTWEQDGSCRAAWAGADGRVTLIAAYGPDGAVLGAFDPVSREPVATPPARHLVCSLMSGSLARASLDANGRTAPFRVPAGVEVPDHDPDTHELVAVRGGLMVRRRDGGIVDNPRGPAVVTADGEGTTGLRARLFGGMPSAARELHFLDGHRLSRDEWAERVALGGAKLA